MDPVEAVRVAVVAQELVQALAPVATAVAVLVQVLAPVATAVAVAQVASPVVVAREDSPEHQQGLLPEALREDAGVGGPEEAVVPVAPVGVVVRVGDRLVPESLVGRSVVNSTIWKLRPLAECGFPKGRARLYDCPVGPR